jgi:hypothetical protein
MHRLLITLALVMIASALEAQTTKPIRYTWITTSCENWNCAAAALVLAGGDKYVLVLPTGGEETPWIVLRRVEEGAIVVDENEPFYCEVFDNLDGAMTQFHTLDGCRLPLILNVPDGRAVVAALRECGIGKRRAVR